MKNINKKITLLAGVLAGATSVMASGDYGPAIWNPASGCTKYYTSGYGHHFVVIHDMEGYYLSSISYLNNCSVSASVHYLVNGQQDTSTDHPAGEITQSVAEANYAWHAGCWNRYMFGTEHEGFASNPAWYTDAMYNATGPLQKHLCDVYGIVKDRNHVIGHSEHNNANWVNWVTCCSGYGFSPTCNTHSDPGVYWDWTRLMNLISGNQATVVSSTHPSSVNVGQGFSATVVMHNSGGTSWTSGGNYNLGSQNPQDNTRWGLGRVATTGTISPGQNSTYTFNCTAPTTAGSYAFDWKMVQDGVEWFGDTASGGINVTANLASAIVDNADAGFSVTGTSWSTGTSSTDKYASNYRYHSTAAVSEPAQWVANLANTGTYAVYAWWPQGGNRSSTAPYVVYYNGGNVTVPKNQQTGGGAWNLLGTWAMNAGNNTVKLSCWTTTGFIVVADAIKWQQQ